MNSHNSGRHSPFFMNWSILVLIAGLMISDVAVGDDKVVKFTAGSPAAVPNTPLTPDQLEDLAGPIALYPDDLIAIILPAAGNPIQIVEAVRFLNRRAADEDLQPDPEWDESVIALLNYPQVLRLMDTNLDWTVKLGRAVSTQQDQLMDAIQQFRRRANAAGNLSSDTKQRVVKEGDNIEIQPADPRVIYVPDYQPEQVVIRQFAPVYDYYPEAYPVYFYPYAPDYQFSTGFFWGLSTAFLVNWNTHYIHSYRDTNFRHPYYGSTYYTNRFLYHDWRNRSRAYRNNAAARGQTRRSDYRRGNRVTVITGALPHRQSVQSGSIRGNDPQLSRRARSFTGAATGNASTALITGGNYRQPNSRSRYTNRNRNVTNGAAVTWRSRQPAAPQRNAYTYNRSLPHISSATSSTAGNQSSNANNSTGYSSRPALPRHDTSDTNNDARPRLRVNPGNAFTSPNTRGRFFRR